MGLFIGILAVLLVLFLIFTMAIAEWADKDIGEVFGSMFNKHKPSPGKKGTLPVVQSETAAQTDSAGEKPPDVTALPEKAIKKAAKKTIKKIAEQSGAVKKSSKKQVVKSTKTAKTKTKSQKGKTK